MDSQWTASITSYRVELAEQAAHYFELFNQAAGLIEEERPPTFEALAELAQQGTGVGKQPKPAAREARRALESTPFGTCTRSTNSTHTSAYDA